MHSGMTTFNIQDETGILTLSNSPKNLLTEPEFVELSVLQEWISSNPSLKSLIITGQGRHFSYGADTSLFSSADPDLTDAKLCRAKQLLEYIEQLPIITVAAVNGACFGGGFEIALSCTFCICSSNALFSFPEILRGVVPGMDGVRRLSQRTGRRRAEIICLTGTMLSAKDALDYGIVDKISEKNCLDEAVEWAASISSDVNVEQLHAIVNAASSRDSGHEFKGFLK